VVGHWTGDASGAASHWGQVRFIHAPVRARQLQRVVAEHEAHWLLVADSLDEELAEAVVSAARAASPDLQVAMLGAVEDSERWDRWVRRGCKAYLRAAVGAEELIQSLAASDGGRFVVIDQQVVEALHRRQTQPTEKLTRREAQVLNLLKTGLRNAEIAVQLGVKSSTVEFHVRNLLEKFAARNRTGIVERARRLGL
jgi:DNA-binding NarL/FixJ family response regulator